MIDLDKTENTCVCLSIIKIELSFRSLFYHDSIIKIFCSREQRTSYVHAHTFIELKKDKIKKGKAKNCEILTKFLRYVLWRPQGSLLCYFGFFFLFRCFDHFIGVFDYSVGRFMFSCNHGQRQRAFSDTKLFFVRNSGT